MSVSIKNNDIIWSSSGSPYVVSKKDEKTGQVIIDENFEKVRPLAKNGIKNGLEPETKEAYNTILTEVSNKDKKQEIDELYEKIKTLKAQNADPRLIRYLEGDLKFRMIRETHKPNNYWEDPITFNL